MGLSCPLVVGDLAVKGSSDMTFAQDIAKLDRPPLGQKILLVDDDLSIQEVMKFFLESIGAIVLTASSGADAIEIALREKPGLILMDMSLPDINGYVATRRLRSHGFGNPIIAMTGRTAQGDRELCIRAGCTDYLAKPADLGQLQLKIEQHLKSPSVSKH